MASLCQLGFISYSSKLCDAGCGSGEGKGALRQSQRDTQESKTAGSVGTTLTGMSLAPCHSPLPLLDPQGKVRSPTAYFWSVLHLLFYGSSLSVLGLAFHLSTATPVSFLIFSWLVSECLK